MTQPETKPETDFIAQVRLFIEQKPEYGEDCEPVLRFYPDGSGLLAVFDGAGGAGGTAYSNGDGGSSTGAFLASRLGEKTLLDFFDELKKQPDSFVPDEMTKRLEERFKIVFKERLAALEPASASKIKSSLIRHLPTTLAAVYYEMPKSAEEKSPVSTLDKAWDWASGRQREKKTAECAANVFWAGDSRCYLLTAAAGLQQLTIDDLKAKGDALENLQSDSPMSNFINADIDFVLNFRRIAISLPAVFIAATDGCFGFVHSPAHFEFILLKSLHLAENADEWQTNLTEEIHKIAGDDATLSLAALGWHDFGEIRRAFHARLQDIHKIYVAPLGQLDEEVVWLKERSQLQEEERKRLRAELWREYKQEYERFLADGGQEK